MNERVGPWTKSMKAVLHGWRLVFNVPSKKWGVAANIIETGNPTDTVFGAVYHITQEQLDILTEKYEHVHPKTKTVNAGRRSKEAKVYIFQQNNPSLKPSGEYLQTILTGLRDQRYLKNIIKSVEALGN